MIDLLGRAPCLAASLDDPGWRMWPFTSLGYEGGFWPVVMKFVFVAVLFVAVSLLLRFLFGPGGPLRGEGWETIQEARAREEARKKSEQKPGPVLSEQRKAEGEKTDGES